MRRMEDKKNFLETILKYARSLFVSLDNRTQLIGENKTFKKKVSVRGDNFTLSINENYFTLSDGTHIYSIQIPSKNGMIKLDQDDSITIVAYVNVASGTTNVPIDIGSSIQGIHTIIKNQLLKVKPLPNIEVWLYVNNGDSEVYHTIIRLESYTFTTGETPFDFRTFYLRFVSTRPVEGYHEYIQITIPDDSHASGIYSRINL